MKKPEKQKIEDKGLIGQFGHWSYNKAIDIYETYHTWDIKTNYILKDGLSVKRINKIIDEVIADELGYYKDIKRVFSKIATELSKQLQKNDKK